MPEEPQRSDQPANRPSSHPPDGPRAADSPDESAAELIRALALPRMTGSSGAARVEADLRARLEKLGYTVASLPFQLSTWPGRFAGPLLGILLLAGAFASYSLILAGAAPVALVILLLAAVLARLALGGGPRASLRLPFGRIRGDNWLARRGERPPAVLVMAHRDSKSQPVSSLGRVAAGAAALLGWLALLAAAVAATLGGAPPGLAMAGLTFMFLGGLGLLPAVTGNLSPGALDNATGLAALLLVAADQREHDDVGFLVTDAEEFGLVGAAAAVGRPPLEAVRAVINMDGLDDVGPLRVCEGHGFPARGRAPALSGQVAEACSAVGLQPRTGALPPGLLCDHIPFAAAGVPAVTLMRGRPGSLARVHRPSDTPGRLTGAGAQLVARAVCHALAEMRRQGLPPVPDRTTLGAS